MSVLDGLAGFGLGMAGAGQAIAAQRVADQRDRELAIREAEERRLAVQERERIDEESANATMTLIDNAGFWNDTKTRIDGKKLVAGLEANDAQARSVALGIARSNGLIDPSVKDARWTKGPNGEWVIQTSNEDGSFGVITVDGSNNPNAPVASFKTLEEFVDVTNEALADTLRYQTKFDNAAALAAEGIVLTDYNVAKQAIEQLPPEEQVATKRGMIAGAANIEDPVERQQFVDAVASGEPPPEPGAPAPEPQAESESQQIGRNKRMRDANERLATTRAERRRSQLPDEIAAAKADLEQVRADFAERGIEPRRMGAEGELEHPTIQQRKDKVTRLEAELAELEPATFTMDTDEQQASVNKVVEETKDMPTEEVVEKVMSGEITVSPEEQAAVATNLQRAGVETVNDLAKLENRRDRAMARVAMIAAIGGTSNKRNPDRTTQRAMLQQITNIFETGTASMSAAEATDANLRAGALDARLGELSLAIERNREEGRTAAIEAGQELMNSWDDVTQGEYSQTAAADWIQKNLGPYLLEAQNARSKADRDIYLRALNPVVGKVLASLAAEERGGFAETLLSFARGDISDRSVGAADFNLDRVEGEYEIRDGKKILIGFYYTRPSYKDSRTGERRQGRRLDEMVPAGRMRNLDPTLYGILALAAQKNESK